MSQPYNWKKFLTRDTNLARAFHVTLEILGASGGDLGLPDGRSRIIEALVWLAWVPGHDQPGGTCAARTGETANPQVKNRLCARICARDAARPTGTGEMRQTQYNGPPPVRRGQGVHQRPPETPETEVVRLITQRRQPRGGSQSMIMVNTWPGRGWQR